MLVFRSQAPQLVNLVDDEKVVHSSNIKSVARQNVRESKAIKHDTTKYSCKIDKTDARSQCSETLSSLLFHIAPKLNSRPSLPAYLIGNIITSAITSNLIMLCDYERIICKVMQINCPVVSIIQSVVL